MALRILVIDGLRHTKLTGYGRLSRSLILALLARGNEIQLQAHEREWESVESDTRDLLASLPRARSEADADAVLVIGPPYAASRRWTKPSLIYTMNDLGGLPPDWVTRLQQLDGVIVPGEFHRRVFSRYVERVYVVPLGAHFDAFRPDPEVKSKRWGAFTLLYVGTFSYRKGTDCLLEVFLSEFDVKEPVELMIHSPGARPESEAKHLLALLERVNPNARVRMNGASLTENELCRLYNQADCFITMTRGEGWGWPVIEALLCETPVIAPRSTAMAEYLTDEIAEFVPVDECAVLELPHVAGFSGGFRKSYGFPGITYSEPRAADARRIARAVVADCSAARAKAIAGRRDLITRYRWEDTAHAVERAYDDLLSDRT